MKAGIRTGPMMSMPAELGSFIYTTIDLPLELIQEPAMVRALEYTFAHPEEAEAVARAEFPTLPPDEIKAVLKRALDDKLWGAHRRDDEGGLGAPARDRAQGRAPRSTC